MAARTRTQKKVAAKPQEQECYEDVIYFMNGSIRVQSDNPLELLIMRMILSQIEWNHIHGKRGIEYYEIVRDKYKFSFDQKFNTQILGLIMDYDGYREFNWDQKDDDEG